MKYELIKPLQSSGKMEVTPQQSEILLKHLLKGLPIEKCQRFVMWTPKQVRTTDNIDLHEMSDVPLHLFDNHFKIEERWLIELSDEETKEVTTSELLEMESECDKFDGFYPWRVIKKIE